MLRTTAVNVIRHLGVVGECNIQYALNPYSQEYCIIEVNARLSRSSALASKATGYPLAYTAAKLGLNIPLNEVKNSVTKNTCACFEPSLDYVVVKILSLALLYLLPPPHAPRLIRSRSRSQNSYPDDQIDEELAKPTDRRLFAIANAFHNGRTVDEIHKLSNIDKWFLRKLEHVVRIDKTVQCVFLLPPLFDLLKLSDLVERTTLTRSRLPSTLPPTLQEVHGCAASG